MSARADLDDIALFSVERWGPDRADRYMAAIDETFVAISENPADGARPVDIDRAWLFRRTGRHRIIYRLEGDEVFVIRILHTSMDERRHLP